MQISFNSAFNEELIRLQLSVLQRATEQVQTPLKRNYRSAETSNTIVYMFWVEEETRWRRCFMQTKASAYQK